jgi:hypothetical protein
MASYEIGFGKPPKRSQFKRGRSGNPNGRPKRKATPVAEYISQVMDARMTYHERGQVRVATRREVSLRLLVERAANGNIAAIEAILKVRQRAERNGSAGPRVLRVENWMRDRPDQTSEEKTKAVQAGRHADSVQRNPKK